MRSLAGVAMREHGQRLLIPRNQGQRAGWATLRSSRPRYPTIGPSWVTPLEALRAGFTPNLGPGIRRGATAQLAYQE